MIALASGLFARIPWKLLLIVAALLALWFGIGRAEDAFSRWRAGVYHDGELAERARVASKTKDAQLADAANVIKTERAQGAVSTGVDHDLQTKLADLRVRFDRLRAAQADRTAAGGGGGPAVPSVPGGAELAAHTAGEVGLPAEDALIASEQALQLQGWIDWYAQQAALAKQP